MRKNNNYMLRYSLRKLTVKEKHKGNLIASLTKTFQLEFASLILKDFMRVFKNCT